MIGGLADWFAVTALFRHPLGIPIPHTALIPKRKDEIGRQLGSFIRIQFLQPKIILEKWRSLEFLQHLQVWLTAKGSIRNIAASALIYSADWVESNSPKATLGKITVANFDAIWREQDMSAKVNDFSKQIFTEERRDTIVDRSIAFVDELLDRKGAALGKTIANELEKSGKSIVAMKLLENWPDLQRKIQAKLYRARYEPDFPLRIEIDKFFERVVTDKALYATVESSFTSFLRDPEIEALINSRIQDQLEQGMGSLFNYLRENAEEIAERMEDGLSPIWQRLFADPVLCRKVERGTEALLLRTVRRYGHSVERFIADEVGNWDGSQTADLIEAQVGKDLQWIRINGSLIGFLCGGLIQTLALLFIH